MMEKRVSKLSITKDDLERRERFNRAASYRLRQQQEHFQDNHDFVANEIKQEIKRLQDDLKGIREIGHYEVKNSTHEMNEASNSSAGMKRKRIKFSLFRGKGKSHSRRKFNRDEGGRKVKFPASQSSSQIISVENYQTAGPNLFNLSRNEKQPKNTQARNTYSQHDRISVKHETRFTEHETSRNEHDVLSGRDEEKLANHGTRLYEHEDRIVGHEKNIDENETRFEKHETFPRITQSTSAESKLHELNVHEARSQARKRILGEHEKDSRTQNEEELANSEEVESYMYVPPDGRKRTVYLLPPLEDLLQEARKARYLRMPKRLINHEDDPERELSIDEIFSKNV